MDIKALNSSKKSIMRRVVKLRSTVVPVLRGHYGPSPCALFVIRCLGHDDLLVQPPLQSKLVCNLTKNKGLIGSTRIQYEIENLCCWAIVFYQKTVIMNYMLTTSLRSELSVT